MKAVFLHLDRTLPVPIYLQIKESIRELIVQGTLRPGERLPSTRQLSDKLGINRMTVDAAFRRLEADGLIQSHVGRGSFVSPLDSTLEAKAKPEYDPEAAARFWTPLFVDSRTNPVSLPTMSPRAGSRSISFVAAAPGPELFPAIEFRRCADFVLKRRISEISRIGSSDGLASLKSYLARWFSQNGMEVSDEEIIITTGCQQAMDLVRKLLLGAADSLVMGNPNYPGAVAALAPTSTERLPMPMVGTEIDGRSLTSLLSQGRSKLIYTVPNFHNPTGASMPLESRRQLCALASQFRVPILEDDVFGELRYSGPVLPTLRSLRPEVVIYIGSFSKMLTPALRVGWMIAPRPVIQQLNILKQSADLHTNLLIQATMEEFCRRDLLNRHMRRMRRVFVKRRDAMAEALRRHFPDESRFDVPDGGLSMWVTLPSDCNTDELARLSDERGVRFLPGSAFYFRSHMHHSLRLSFASETEEKIEQGIRTLGSLLGNRKSRLYFTEQPALERAQPIV